MATIVSQLSQTLQVLIPITEEILVRARKSMKTSEKNIAKVFAENLYYLMHINGRLTGFDVTADSSNLTLAAGKFIKYGYVAESFDETTVTDPMTLTPPYYLHGIITNADSSNPTVSFGFTDSTAASFSKIATYDGTSWEMQPILELGKIWLDLLNHAESQSLHADALMQLALNSPTAADSTNPYATKADLYTYNRADDVNDMLVSLIELMELETNTHRISAHKFGFDNMFADVISVSGDTRPAGKYGTLFNAWQNGFQNHVGLHGIYNDSDSTFSFETGVIRQLESIDNHIMLTLKQALIGVPFGAEIDVQTDGTTWPIMGYQAAQIIDGTALDLLQPSSSGTYDLNIRFVLPAASGGSYWSVKQSLTRPTCMHGAQFLNNKLYAIGGSDSTYADSGIQEYNHINDSVSIFATDFNRRSVASSKDEFLNKVHVFNSYDSSNTINSNIAELTLSNQSVINVATGLSAWGSTGTNLADDYTKSVFGTGYNSGGTHLSDWKSINNFTKTSATNTSYPAATAGVSSVASRYVTRKVYNYGGHITSGTQSNINNYDVISDSFSTLTPTAILAPNSTTQSYGESAIFTLKKTMFICGVATGTFDSESFGPEASEYNIFQNTLTKMINMSSNIGHTALELAPNGRLYSLGGRLGNSGSDLSSNLNYQYTPSSMTYLYGWGVEWL